MHWSLLKWFPLFIWLLFAVSSMSSFRPDTGGRRWCLVQVRWFSPAAGREGRCRQIITVCGEHSPCSGHTGFAPTHGCMLYPSTLLSLPAALYGAGPALRAVPVLGSSTKARTWLGLHFVPSPPSSSGSQELDGRTLPGAVRLLPSMVPASVSAHPGWVHVPWV